MPASVTATGSQPAYADAPVNTNIPKTMSGSIASSLALSHGLEVKIEWTVNGGN
jgi:hypothetical protein